MVMASIGEMMDAAAAAMGGAADSVETFLGFGDSLKEAAQVVGDVASSVPGVGDAGGDLTGIAGDAVASTPGVGDVVSRAESTGVSTSGWGLMDWSAKQLDKMMPEITKAAMTPKPTQRAPLGGSGHGVTASAGSNSSVINEITGMAGGDPLQGLNSWKNLL